MDTLKLLAVSLFATGLLANLLAILLHAHDAAQFFFWCLLPFCTVAIFLLARRHRNRLRQP